MRDSLVHIFVAAYNRAHLIEETLGTIKNQTYPHFKCYIIDDHSTDETAARVQDFSKRDKRFIYYLKPDRYHQGLPDSRNYSLDLAIEAGATFIQFFDDDDWMHPQKLELQMEALQSHHEFEMSCCDYKNFTDDKLPEMKMIENPSVFIEERLGFKFIWRQLAINSLGPIFTIDLFKGFRFTNSLVIGEERELYLKMFFTHKPQVIWVDEPLFYYRKHVNSNTGSRYASADKEISNKQIYNNLFNYFDRNDLFSDDLIAFFGHYYLGLHQNPPQITRLKQIVHDRKKGDIKNKLFWIFLRSNSFVRKILLKILINHS